MASTHLSALTSTALKRRDFLGTDVVIRNSLTFSFWTDAFPFRDNETCKEMRNQQKINYNGASSVENNQLGIGIQDPGAFFFKEKHGLKLQDARKQGKTLVGVCGLGSGQVAI